MTFINLPSPVSLVPLDTPQSILGQAAANNDFLRFLFGNGQGTRIVNPDGVPVPIEMFYQNLNEYGVTLSNKFFVLINGPGFDPRTFGADRTFFPTIFPPFLPGAAAVASATSAANKVLSLLTPNPSQKDTMERLAILCNTASFPKINITSSKLELIPSMQENIARYMNFSENSTMTLKFYNSSSMYERSYFEGWMNTVANIKTGLTNFYDEYAKKYDITVLKMPANGASMNIGDGGYSPEFGKGLYEQRVTPLKNGQGNNFLTGYIYGVKYMECYPVEVSAVDFVYGKSNITETTVTFSYKYFESPANKAFLENAETAPISSYGDYLESLKQLTSGFGKVAYNPQANPADNLASAVNGAVNAATNIAGRIRQIF